MQKGNNKNRQERNGKEERNEEKAKSKGAVYAQAKGNWGIAMDGLRRVLLSIGFLLDWDEDEQR